MNLTRFLNLLHKVSYNLPIHSNALKAIDKEITVKMFNLTNPVSLTGVGESNQIFRLSILNMVSYYFPKHFKAVNATDREKKGVGG